MKTERSFLLLKISSVICLLLAFPLSIFGAVAPLGFTVGKAKAAEVMAGIKGKTSVEEAGINKYSEGRMLKAGGSGLEIEGLQEVIFIFDKEDILVGTLMTMGKGSFEKVYGYMAGKYKVVNKNIPFVGNKYVKFKDGNVTIEINAPHMSFEMEVSYFDERLNKAFNTISQQESQQKKKRESSQF